MTEYSYLNLSEEHVDQFNYQCPLNEYRVIKPSDLSQDLLSIVPNGLWEKTDSLFLMSSGSAVATAYCMINCNRWDFRASAIDQEPILFAHIGGTPRLDGIVVHHGNWPGRTTEVPPEFYPYLDSSGLGNHFPIASIPGTMSGSITDLTHTAQRGAFEAGVQRIIKLAEEKGD